MSVSARMTSRKRSVSPDTSTSSRGLRSVRWKAEAEERVYDPNSAIPGWEDDGMIGEEEMAVDSDDEREERGDIGEKKKRVS